LDQMQAVATGAEPVRPDVAVVLALAGPCRLLERVAPDRSTRREAKRRIAAATGETPFAPVAGVIALITASTVALAILVAATLALWLVATARHAFIRPAVPGGGRHTHEVIHPGADQALIGASSTAHTDELPNRRAVVSDTPRVSGEMAADSG
jgi:hypothetical protein